MDWFNSTILGSIFTDNDCGNGICSAPEEYPSLSMGDRHFPKVFDGCIKDCGDTETFEVTVDFFDAYKLAAAYETVYNARDNGWSTSDGKISGVTWTVCESAHTHARAGGWASVCGCFPTHTYPYT